MQPSCNLVADTICRTAEIGLTFTGAADAGALTIIDAASVAVEGALPRLHLTRETFVVTLSADWLACRSWGFHPPACLCLPIGLHLSTMSEENLLSLPRLCQ